LRRRVVMIDCLHGDGVFGFGMENWGIASARALRYSMDLAWKLACCRLEIRLRYLRSIFCSFCVHMCSVYLLHMHGAG
jgi:hypothetical protein